ncbi:MAG: hypothetical protein GJ676_07790 [Rhodobacteraceae bacterium]|nr:hypothetical protein [Paracoccaceae bacterium]
MRFLSVLTLSSLLAMPATASEEITATDGSGWIGHVACANQDGAPLSQCPYEALPKENGNVTLRIAMPGGTTRVIYVEGGTPTSSDTTARLGSKRLAQHTVVLIDPSERFEIPNDVLDPR